MNMQYSTLGSYFGFRVSFNSKIKECHISRIDDEKNTIIPFKIFKYKKAFIGKSRKNKFTVGSGAYGPEFDGNTILLQISQIQYIYIGPCGSWCGIIKFRSSEQITRFESPVGNSNVPHAYAITETGKYIIFSEGIILTKNKVLSPAFKNALKSYGLDQSFPYDLYECFKYLLKEGSEGLFRENIKIQKITGIEKLCCERPPPPTHRPVPIPLILPKAY
jgi:hypothetical protein